MQYLIDASVYVFRAWHSMPPDLVDGDGNPVNALYGYCRFLGDFLEQVRPEHAAVLFDESLTTSFRNRLYPGYKANRERPPEELKRQFRLCRRFTRAIGVMECAHPTFEADDLIGTLVVEARASGMPSTVVSRDKDLAQLIGPEDVFWDFAGKGRLTYAEIPGVFGVRPEQIADFLALAGDGVDNIPGVPGVGRKTAAALLGHFGSLDAIYANLDRVCDVDCRGAKTLAGKLEAHREAALLSRSLTAIACDVPYDRPLTGLRVRPPELGALNALCDETGFGTALRRQAERLADLVAERSPLATELAPARA
ncbi:MAG TPA: 5'-3' exonuclease H3TH domain-containing protein [Woeseiaceae bacterium]|jgi:5'-3' exonuclease|nr:5'-3' exonuclease H3TH domain-containing protein [Woeseiaceae bacterium]